MISGCVIAIASKELMVVLQDAKGTDVNLGIYKGKVLLIVNVASQWYVAYINYLCSMSEI